MLFVAMLAKIYLRMDVAQKTEQRDIKTRKAIKQLPPAFLPSLPPFSNGHWGRWERVSGQCFPTASSLLTNN